MPSDATEEPVSEAPMVVLLAGGLRDDPTTEAVTKAMRLALGSDAIVLVDTSEVRDDAAALGLAERSRAHAVARIVWTDDTHRAAHVDVHVTSNSPGAKPSAEWERDDLTFADDDAPAERARTVGFTIASMVQHVEAVTTPPAGPEPLVTVMASPRREDSPPTPSPRYRIVTDASVRGAVSHGAGTPNYGGALGAELWLHPSVAATGTFGARFGTIQATAIAERLLLAGGGLAVRLVTTRRIEANARADLLVVQQSARRTYATGQETRSRWLAGTEVMGELSYWITTSTALTVSAGIELVSAGTNVDVGAARVADLPVWRALTQGGLTIRL